MALEATGVDFRDRWKASAGEKGRARSSRFFAAVMLTTAALLCVALVAGLLLGPVFTWQTAFVTLVIDEYPLGVIEPVPFGTEDSQALAESLSGALHTRLGTTPVTLGGFDSLRGVRDRLLPTMRGLDVRGKDVLLAYVRGQSFVAPPIFDDAGLDRDDTLAGVPCMLASDCELARGRPAEVVPIRDLVEAVGASASRLTLVALDLGDLQWDPRLGVLGHVVPIALDREFAKPQTEATSNNWVIGSHDLFQVSSASIEARRTCFARALELALSGDADRSTSGNGNGVIELDEVARFVSLWTNEWSRRLSGGRSRQTPVVWKLGVGRVALGDIPAGIALMRVPKKRVASVIANLSGDTATETPGGDEKPAGLPNANKEAPADGEEKQPAPSPDTKDEKQNVEKATTIAPVASPDIVLASFDEAATGAIRLVSAEDATEATTLAFPGAPPDEANLRGATAETPDTTKEPPASSDEVADKTSEEKADGTAPPQDDTGAEKGKPPTQQEGDTPRDSQSKPTPPPSPPLPRDAWEALALLGQRKLEPAVVDGTPAILPVPADYAAPWWRNAYAIAASAESRASSAAAMGERGQKTLNALGGVLARMVVTPFEASPEPSESPVADQLWAARSAASKAGYFPLWSAAPDAFCRVVATRNEALAGLVSAVDIVGQVSGGNGTPPLDPESLTALAMKIQQLNELLASGADAVGISRLTSAARGISSQHASIVDQVQRLAEGMHRDRNDGSSPVVSRTLSILRSASISEASRQHILQKVYRSRPKLEESVLMATGRPAGVLLQSTQIDQASLENIAALAGCVAAVVEAAVLSDEATDLRNDINAVRREITSTSNPTANDEERLDNIVRLGGRVAHLMTSVGAIASDVSRAKSSRGLLVDQRALLFRVMDVRDIKQLEPAVVTGLPDWSAQDAFGLSLKAVDAVGLQIGKPNSLRLGVDSGGVLPNGSQIRFVFDPAAIEVRFANGTNILPNVSWPVESLQIGTGGLALTVLPRRYATTPKETVSLEVIWESLQQAASAQADLSLPTNRSVMLATRSSMESDWQRTRILTGTTDAVKQAEVPLAMIPGVRADWQLALVNEAEIPREFTGALYSVGDASAGITSVSLGRDVVWQRFAEKFSRGESIGPPLAAIEKLPLPVGQTPVPVVFPPEKPAAAAPPTAAKEQASPEQKEAPQEIGPDLALVFTEITKGQPDQKWLFRLRCEQVHPRGLLEASATWVEATGSVEFAFRLSEAWGDNFRIPEDGVRVTIEPLQLDGPSTVQVRRGQTVLTQDRPSDTLVANWTGTAPTQPARVAVNVNDYPRAFVFEIACDLAHDRQPQHPQRDWRMLRILEPAQARTVLKSPALSIPLLIQVDAPPDASRGGADATPLASLGLRELQAGTLVKQPQRLIWISEADRSQHYILDKATPPVSLAIQPEAKDWILELPGEGFVDVDVEAEVRLVLPGSQPPLTTARQFVFDGRPPAIEVPPLVNVEVGLTLVVPVQVTDDPREAFAGLASGHLPGVAGVDKVEWAFDLKGDGKPEEWKPAVATGGSLYEVRAETKALPIGARVPLLVRASDRTGLTAPPSRVWLQTAAKAAKGRIEGRVVLDGRGEENVPVTISGPGAPPSVKTGKDGAFAVTGLEPGDYELKADGVVRNVTHTSESQKVKVELPPAPPVNVVIELK